MNKEDCFRYGYISKTHSFKGEIIIITEGEPLIQLNTLRYVFIEINERLIPFFIEHSQESGSSSIIVKFLDVNTEAKALQLLVKCDVYIPLSLLPEQKKSGMQTRDFKGFKVIDDVYGDIGVVNEIQVMPQHLILSVQHQSKEIFIPANKEIVYKTDGKRKIIYTHCPEGLIDMYIAF